ncbi:hypothetical protein PMAYCL1PPCAC_05150, partial [Pristionchus mayeri]
VLVTGRINYIDGAFSHVDMDEEEVDISQFTDIQKPPESPDKDDDDGWSVGNYGHAYVVKMSARSILNILELQGWKVVCMAKSNEAAGTSNQARACETSYGCYAWTLHKEVKEEPKEEKEEPKKEEPVPYWSGLW